MSWLQFRIDSSAALAPSCEEHLLVQGAVAVTLPDNAEQEGWVALYGERT